MAFFVATIPLSCSEWGKTMYCKEDKNGILMAGGDCI